MPLRTRRSTTTRVFSRFKPPSSFTAAAPPSLEPFRACAYSLIQAALIAQERQIAISRVLTGRLGSWPGPRRGCVTSCSSSVTAGGG